MAFDETKGEKNSIMDESSLKAPNLESTSLDIHVEETMEVQTQAQVNDIMKFQVCVYKVEAMEVLLMGTKISFESLYMPLEIER